MRCRIEFSSGFWEDYERAIRYICLKLQNSVAARALDEEFDRIIKIVQEFPRLSSPYPMTDETGAEYRFVSVKNYLAFYVIHTESQADVVEFRRFLYSGSDYMSHL